MVVQVSLNPGQEKASYQTAEFAQAFFSEENLKEARSFDQKENAKRFRDNLIAVCLSCQM